LERVPQDFYVERWRNKFEDKSDNGERLPTYKPEINTSAPDLPVPPRVGKYPQCDSEADQIWGQIKKFILGHNDDSILSSDGLVDDSHFPNQATVIYLRFFLMHAKPSQA
jgi:hypothetical protein